MDNKPATFDNTEEDSKGFKRRSFRGQAKVAFELALGLGHCKQQGENTIEV
jgi:hypothetical protein